MNVRLALVRSTLLIAALLAPRLVPNAGATEAHRLSFNVSLADGAPCTVVGYLYYEGSLDAKPLQVAVHGATYNHTYWDFPAVNGQSYSYARYMTNLGYAVLAVDQVGAGESCRPGFPDAPGFPVTLADTAGALKQVVDAMRSGANGSGKAFSTIVLVGHSAGSINVIYAQAQWQIADAIVVTAARHLVAPLQAPPGLQDLVVALLPYSYFSLPPEIRTALFHYLPAVDPAVVSLDNETADLWTNGQLVTTFMAFLNPAIDQVGQVTGPALVQLGEFDALFPAGAAHIEEALWASTKVKVRTLPGIGHDFNLALDRERGWARIAEWVNETLTEREQSREQ